MGDFNEKPSGAFPTFAITPSVRHKPKLQLAATRGSPTTPSKEHHDRYAGLQPKIKAFDRLRSPRERKLKSNSTASIYVNSTISSPDLDELLRTLAVAILIHVEAGQKIEKPTFLAVFDERIFPVSNEYDPSEIPTVDSIYTFLHTIFTAERLSAECGIMCLAYLERMLAQTGLTLHANNWRRATLSALILASKVWEDQAVWNVDFLSLFPSMSVKDLGELEKHFLNYLKFNVSLNRGLYAKYYFELRNLSDKEDKFPMQALDKSKAKKLEERSESEEERCRREVDEIAVEARPRSNSVDEGFQWRSARVIIN